MTDAAVNSIFCEHTKSDSSDTSHINSINLPTVVLGSKSNLQQLLACHVQPLQLLGEFFSAVNNIGAFLSQLLAYPKSIGAVDAQASIHNGQNTPLDTAHEFVVNCKWYVVRKSFVCD